MSANSPLPTATILRTGPSLSVQDLGRHGWRRYGVAPAGALDFLSARLANDLVGNSPESAVLEAAMAGTVIEFHQAAWVAIAGASGASELPSWSAKRFSSGDKLHLTGSSSATWTYVAIEGGGWDVPTVLGSRSYHSRSDLGFALKEGSELHSSHSQLDIYQNISRRYIPPEERVNFASSTPLSLSLGPHHELFTEEQKMALAGQKWRLSPLSDRTGYRFLGETPLSHDHSIMSCPVIVGSIQIPSDGQPIVTLNDGPTLGGYPVIATLDMNDVAWLVQQHPQTQISFQW